MKNIGPRRQGGRMSGMLTAGLMLIMAFAIQATAQQSAAPPVDSPAATLDPRTIPLSLDSAAPTANAVTTPATATPATPTAPATSANPAIAPAAAQGNGVNVPAPAEAGDNPEKLRLDKSARAPGEGASLQSGGSAGSGLWQLIPALVLVLVLLAGGFWAARRYMPGFRRLGGSPAIRVLGRTHLSPRQSVALVKIGRRVLVVGATGEHLTALGSITDAAEVSELLGIVESGRAASASSSFRSALKEADDSFAPVDEIDGPAAMVSISQEQAETESAGEAGGENEDVGRIRSELDQIRRKVRDAMGR